MRIVALADTHMFHDELAVPDGDVLVHAGDMARSGAPDELTEVARFLRALPHPTKIVVAGNHDRLFETQPERARQIFEGLSYLQDSELVVDGVRFWGAPWQPEFHSWAFNLPRGAALAEKWALIPEGIDVLITHGPPEGYGDKVSDRRGAGCRDLLERVQAVRPRLHLFGHIHQDRGVWREGDITFANVTTWECDLAPAVFDLLDGVVTPVVP